MLCIIQNRFEFTIIFFHHILIVKRYIHDTHFHFIMHSQISVIIRTAFIVSSLEPGTVTLIWSNNGNDVTITHIVTPSLSFTHTLLSKWIYNATHIDIRIVRMKWWYKYTCNYDTVLIAIWVYTCVAFWFHIYHIPWCIDYIITQIKVLNTIIMLSVWKWWQ